MSGCFSGSAKSPIRQTSIPEPRLQPAVKELQKKPSGRRTRAAEVLGRSRAGSLIRPVRQDGPPGRTCSSLPPSTRGSPARARKRKLRSPYRGSLRGMANWAENGRRSPRDRSHVEHRPVRTERRPPAATCALGEGPPNRRFDGIAPNRFSSGVDRFPPGDGQPAAVGTSSRPPLQLLRFFLDPERRI